MLSSYLVLCVHSQTREAAVDVLTFTQMVYPAHTEQSWRNKPDILVLLETMVTSPEKWQIPGYRLETKFAAVESSSRGRPSGGAAAWVSSEYTVPINTAKVSTPPNCLALVFGDDKSGGLKGLLALYRRYTTLK